MGSLLVIDNGTFECRAGDSEDNLIRFRNQIFRTKEKDGSITYSLSPNKKSTITKSMFDGSVIYNYYVLTGTIKEIIRELKIQPKNLLITECFLNPRMFQEMILLNIFNSFSFESVQLGYDFIYSYEYNLKHNNLSEEVEFKREFCDVIVSMGNLGVYVVPVDPIKKKILYEESTHLLLGGNIAQFVFSKSVINKYVGTGVKVSKEEVEEYFKRIRVPINYTEEIEEVVNQGKGNVKIHQKQIKPQQKQIKKEKTEKVQQKKRKIEVKTKEVEEYSDKEDTTEKLDELDNLAEGEIDKEDTTEKLDGLTELNKKIRRDKLIKGATDHRNKQKIVKVLDRLKYHLFLLEDRFLLLNNKEEFMKIRRDRLEGLEKTLKRRNFVRNELKNKKSMHSLILLKKSLNQLDGKLDSNSYLEEIKEAGMDDLDILGEIEYIDLFLRENDERYVVKEENPLDKIREGVKEKGGININIEFIRTGEALFNPSIIGLEQPGIGESLSYVFMNRDVRNIFITGGFSQIEGIKERIEKEIESLRYFPNTPLVTVALDPVNDAYRGGFIKSEYFKSYKRDEFMREYEEKERKEKEEKGE